MASVTFDIVRSVIEAEGLDKMIATGPGKKGKLLEADTHDEVLEGLAMLQQHATGAMELHVWKTGIKKDDGYVWSVGTPVAVAGGVGAFGGGAGPSWDQYMNTRIELETLKLRNELAPKEDGIGGLHKTLALYAPIIAKSMGVALPGVSGTDDDDDDDDDDAEEVPGMSEDEVRDGLRDVVAFMKRHPDQAKTYLEMMRKM